mmetsp:Transcript_21759/g.61927  ORF Transcript_21759/g.61927 Transcript_21759/m.61927 type:complete len:680 (-) Transcript_21759:148-2187(-)
MVVSGIIRPPPEIRAVADRTAKFVAKNGRAFEKRILKEKRAKTPKFSFLQPTSPFHPYYEDRIKFYEEGGKDEDESKKTKDESKGDGDATANAKVKKEENRQQQKKKQMAKKQKASVIDPIAKLMLRQRERLQQQRKSKNASEENKAEGDGDGDNIKDENSNNKDEKKAPAKDGNATNEAEEAKMKPLKFDLINIIPPSNLPIMQIETIQLAAQFAAMDVKGGSFLHQLSQREWKNPTFAFCQPRHHHFPYFSALVDAYRGILADWSAAADQDDNGKGGKDNKKHSDMTKILEEVAFTAEYERDRKAQNEHEDNGILAIDWQDFVVVETIEFAKDEVVVPLPPPPPVPEESTEKSAADGEGMDESDDDDDNEDAENIRVVPSYTPKVVGPANVQAARAIDPITGKSVAVADMPEHMRIQLLDPKWAEEHKKFQDKQKDSNLVSDDAVAANLSKLTSKTKYGDSGIPTGSSKKRPAQADAQAPIIAPAFAPAPTVSVPPPPPPPPPPSGPGNEPPHKRHRTDQAAANASGSGGHAAPAPKKYRGPAPLLATMNVGDAAMEDHDIAMDIPSGPKTILPEDEFVASLDSTDVTLMIRIPNDPAHQSWNFMGQMCSLTVPVTSTVMSVKKAVSKEHLNDMPAKKIQLKDPSSGFLSNGDTLAKLNIGPKGMLELVPKKRGGRR